MGPSPARHCGFERQQPGADQRRAANQRHEQCRRLHQRQQSADQYGGAGGHGLCLRQRSWIPHISPESARLQIARVAAARGLSQDKVKELVGKFVEPPQWGFLGQSRVNVLLLNVALDQLAAQKKG